MNDMKHGGAIYKFIYDTVLFNIYGASIMSMCSHVIK